MRAGWKFFFLALIVLGGVLALVPPLALRYFSKDREFQAIAERSVGELLQADVQIRKMNLGAYNELSLTGFEIHSPHKNLSYQFQAQKISFRFNFLEMLFRKLRRPSEVVFSAPKLVVQTGDFPYNFLTSLAATSGRGRLSSFSFQGGELEWFVEPLRLRLHAYEMSGKMDVVSENLIKINLLTKFSGAVSGKARISGVVDLKRRTHQLQMRLEQLSSESGSLFPLQDLNGILRWEDRHIIFDSLNFKVQGWDTQASGRFFYDSAQPRLFLNWKIKDRPGMRLEVNSKDAVFYARLYEQEILRTSVRGAWSYENLALQFRDLVLDDKYQGAGLFHFGSGLINLDFSTRENSQRFSVALDFRKREIKLGLKFDHFHFLELDWVVHGEVALEPQYYSDGKKLSSLKGILDTTQFVVGYVPLEDFESTFLVTPSGLDMFQASWGKHFHLSGEVRVAQEKFSGTVGLQVRDFDVSQVEQMGLAPLSHRLEGILDGKLKAEGDLRRPDCRGQFTIRDGRADSLTFDRASIHFSGVPPLLILSDSKAFKGRHSFDLTGSIDLSLPNILDGLLIQTPDRWAAWKGSEFDPSQGHEMDLKKKSSSLPALTFKIDGTQVDEPAEKQQGGSKDDTFVGIGPKINF